MVERRRSPWQAGGLPQLNVAETSFVAEILGPGLRGVVSVQGCRRRCRGCLAPEWRPLRLARLVSPEELAAELLVSKEVTGLTFTGGEPMLQAAGLAALVTLVRQQRDVSLICFTGYTLSALRTRPPGPGVRELLTQADVLIDGPYVEALNDNQGLRGSSNQVVHHLTPRLGEGSFDFEGHARRADIIIDRGVVYVIGVPPLGLPDAVEQVFNQRTKEKVR